jgi:hypothetical protein
VNANILVGGFPLTTTIFGSPAQSALNVNVVNQTSGSVTIPTPTDWGTAPATSVLVPAVNSELFAGQVALTAKSSAITTGTLDVNIVGALGSTMSKTHPLFTEISDGTNAMGAMAQFETAPSVNSYALNTNSALFALRGDGTSNTKALNWAFFGELGTSNDLANIPYALITDSAIYGVYNSTLPTLSTGNFSQIQLDSSGRVLVSGTIAVSNFPTSIIVNQGTNPWAVSLTNNLYTDGAAESVGNFTGTVAMGYNGTDLVGLRLDPSNNLYVDLSTALPAGGNVIGGITNPALSEMTFTNYGSPAVEALNVYVVNPGSTVITGTVAVSNFPASQVVTLASTTISNFPATVAVTQSTSPWIVAGGGTAGSAASGVLTVQGIASMTPLLVTATFSSPQHVIVDSGSGGVQYADTAASGSHPTGTLAMGWYAAGNEVLALRTYSDGTLIVNTATGVFLTQTNGALGNNNAATSTMTGQVGVLPFTANAADPSWTEGYQVTGSVTLSGYQRVILHAETTKVIGTVNILGNAGAVMDAVTTAATAPANGLATLVKFLPQASQPALTTGQSVMVQGDQTGAVAVNTEGRKATFSTSAAFTAAAGVIAVLPGSATKTIRVLRVEVSIYTTGTAAIETISLIVTSAAPSGGTSAATTIVPHDSGNAAVTAAPLSYTVAPTPGTPVGTIRSVAFADSTAAIPPGANTWLWDWSMRAGQAVVLRGTAQTLEINLGGAVSTQSAIISIEWTEE